MKPILFNTAMVQAILEGRKTTTRRIIKNKTGWNPPTNYNYVHFRNELNGDKDNLWCGFADKGCFDNPCYCKAPYMPRDILYVRETWLKAEDGKYYFRANETPVSKEAREDFGYKWHPSLHMPKEAARIFLKVISVKVQRLSDMEEEDYFKEGIRAYTKDGKVNKFAVNEDQYKWQDMPRNIQKPFFDLWNSTLKKEQLKEYGWESNPYVWVIEFERIEKSEVE